MSSFIALYNSPFFLQLHSLRTTEVALVGSAHSVPVLRAEILFDERTNGAKDLRKRCVFASATLGLLLCLTLFPWPAAPRLGQGLSGAHVCAASYGVQPVKHSETSHIHTPIHFEMFDFGIFWYMLVYVGMCQLRSWKFFNRLCHHHPTMSTKALRTAAKFLLPKRLDTCRGTSNPLV